MKKLFGVVVLFAIVAVSLSSCKSHEKCPAYSKANSKIVKY
jgi:hypothetical protein